MCQVFFLDSGDIRINNTGSLPLKGLNIIQKKPNDFKLKYTFVHKTVYFLLPTISSFKIYINITLSNFVASFIK